MDVSGLVGVLALRLDLALSWSLAEVENEDLGFDCARNESDFCVEPLGGILSVALRLCDGRRGWLCYALNNSVGALRCGRE